MNYNFFQKKLHNLCLGSKSIKKSLFEIEKLIFHNSIKIKNEKHIFITSLPRSGTSALLEFIYSSNEFGSLLYKDMPFVLSPNLFSKFSSKKNIIKKERMHKDGMFYNLNTPEAFDEVFFLTFENELDWENNFLKYIELILIKNKKQKYLSKNNYNFKRLHKIKKIFPESKFLVPFREPLEHAYSMMTQNLNFKKQQNDDKFVLKYTNYLGHLEFGNNHKPWFKPDAYKDTSSINYWLEQWFLYFKELLSLKTNLDNCYLINIDKFCNNQNYQIDLLKKLNISEKTNFTLNYKKKIVEENFDKILFEKCKKLYIDLENN